MSRADTDLVGTDAEPATACEATLLEPREVPLGGPRALLVRRTLPHKVVRTIGAWCFVDHFGPVPVSEQGMHVPPHPHIGLQTVTWLYSGDVLHRDGLGSVQRVRPGELNLMTAGRGIAHSEDSVTDDGADTGGPASPGADVMHGIQFWVALPDASRHQAPHFEHHADLPTVEVGDAVVTLVLGALGLQGADAVRSPAATYSPIVGADVALAVPADRPARADLPLDPAFEHGVLAVDADLVVDGEPVPRGALLHLPPGRTSVTVRTATGAADGTATGTMAGAAGGTATAFLLGGEPLGAPPMPTTRLLPR